MLLWTFMCTSFCVNICLCFFQVDIWEWAYGSPVLTFLRKARLFYSIPLYEYTTFSCQFTTWWAFALLFVFSNKHSCASFLWTFFFTLRQICRSRIAGSQDRCQSVQSLSRVRLFATPGLQHARPPCPSPTPGVYSDSCPLSQWCHPTIASSVIPFFSHLQSFPASGSDRKSTRLNSSHAT